MDNLSLSQLTSYAPDVILILISGLACLYCWMLNRRLKNLNSLKSGVGASIVSLTKAIEDTHKAAQEAQRSTQEAVKTLNALLETARMETPRVAALVVDLEHARDSAKAQRQKLDDALEITLPNAIAKAQKTAAGLLKIVSDLNESQADVPPRKTSSKDEDKSQDDDNTSTVKAAS